MDLWLFSLFSELNHSQSELMKLVNMWWQWDCGRLRWTFLTTPPAFYKPVASNHFISGGFVLTGPLGRSSPRRRRWWRVSSAVASWRTFVISGRRRSSGHLEVTVLLRDAEQLLNTETTSCRSDDSCKTIHQTISGSSQEDQQHQTIKLQLEHFILWAGAGWWRSSSPCHRGLWSCGGSGWRCRRRCASLI